MTVLRQIGEAFSHWIDAVATAVVAWLGWFSAPRTVQLVEESDGVFAVRGGKRAAAIEPQRIRIVDGSLIGELPPKVADMLKGGRAEIVLQPSRFLFRPLELPGRASEFLDGIVRAQIDRLTPWSAADAVFGWSKPAVAGPDRIMLTVAATARALVTPYVKAIGGAGARSISVATALPDLGAGVSLITVMEEQTRRMLDVARVRRVLSVLLALAALATLGGFGAATVVGNSLDAERDDFARRIAGHRAAAVLSRDAPVDAATARQRALDRRKHETPAGVMVLEMLSQVLPDHTYVTELRIEGDKLRVVGVTQNAPSLIGLIEQSRRFTRATFFAPTTRSPSDPGERFHIEAQIEPSFGARS